MIDFAALPPEVNSARMYAGPGSGPLLAAAAAWNTIAAEMRSAATSYDAVVAELTNTSWFGPSSMSMLAAAVPYVDWLSSSASQAEQAGSQANAAATAFESAFALTVPPAVVAANRAELAMLVATNVLGQNTPAIAATEAQYAEMWAQDAAAMNGYAGASSAATQLTPFNSPQSTANPAAATNATPNAVTPGSVTSSLANLLNGSDQSALGTFLQSNVLGTEAIGGTLAGGPFNPEPILSTIAGFNFLMDTGSKAAASAAVVPGAGSLPGALASGTELTGLGSAASAGLGRAHLVGTVSVPPSWTSAASIPQAESATAATGLDGIGSSSAGGPGGVAGPMVGNGRRMRRTVPKYGFRPVVMPRPPAAG